MLELVTIDSKYIDYLRNFDNKVCFNKDFSHTRPYVGVVFKLKDNRYFAPLTSSGKGAKLKQQPKIESLTFFPIKNCSLGGVNMNNMIPVIDDVLTKIDMQLSENDTEEDIAYKTLLIEQLRFLSANEKLLRKKANIIYSMKNNGKLYPNYNKVTCNFKLLEEKSKEYGMKNFRKPTAMEQYFNDKKSSENIEVKTTKKNQPADGIK